MKNLILTLLLAVLVVVASSGLRQAFAIGGSPAPPMPKVFGIGGPPAPPMPPVVGIGGSPAPPMPK